MISKEYKGMYNKLNNMSKKYQAFFHKLHCILRDGELGLTGLSALNEINNIIFYIFIECSDIIKLNENEKFSKLYEKYVTGKIEKTSKVSGGNTNELIQMQKAYNINLNNIFKNANAKKYIFSDTNGLTAFRLIDVEDIDKNVSYANQLYELLKESKYFFLGKDPISEINIKQKLDEIDFDILGDAYEKFKEDEVGNQGKRTGQYFTPRTIIKFIIENQIKPKDNELCYDSSCGTGGFIHYLNK